MLIPAFNIQPAVRFAGFRCIEAALDPRLELRNSQLFIVQAAAQQLCTAFKRVHVAINEARHQRAAMKVNGRRLRTDKRRHSGITADVCQPAIRDRHRLLHRVGRIGGIDMAIAIHDVRRLRVRMGTAGAEPKGNENADSERGSVHVETNRIMIIVIPPNTSNESMTAADTLMPVFAMARTLTPRPSAAMEIVVKPLVR